MQAEYSAFETLHETDGLVDTARDLNISFIAYGPLGHGWLVENFPYETPDDFAPEDYRRQSRSLIRYLETNSVTNIIDKSPSGKARTSTPTRE